jgi:hypothetical protein
VPRLDAGEATIGDSAGSGASLTFVSGKRKRQTTALSSMKQSPRVAAALSALNLAPTAALQARVRLGEMLAPAAPQPRKLGRRQREEEDESS